MAIAKSDKKPYLWPPGPAGSRQQQLGGVAAGASGGLGPRQGQEELASAPGCVCLGEFLSQTHLIAKKVILPLRVVQSIKMKEK